MASESFQNAKINKNDEFYTQYEDIEKEINAYYEYNRDVFRNKTILVLVMIQNGQTSQNTSRQILKDLVLKS